MSSPFTGSLGGKRKHELVEIAEALNISDPEAKMTELKEKIQSHLDTNETKLSKTPQFKGLYGRKRATSDEGSPVNDAKAAVNDVVKKSRKSINKTLEKVLDAASIPLPESPANLGHRAATNVDSTVSNALVPAQNFQKDLQIRAKDVSDALVKFTGERRAHVEKSIAILQGFFSKPEHLITSSIAVELLLIFRNLLQFYDHTLFFPPVGGAKGDFYSLLHSLFGWAPRTTLNLRYPEFQSIFDGNVWSAISWWFFFTVLPPLALSTIVSFQPQKGFYRTPTTTRSQANRPPVHRFDPLAYALFRFALLLFPLTTAAPSSIVDALDISGDAQGRALGAGLLAALIGSERLGAQ